jgi:hypothetical protein
MKYTVIGTVLCVYGTFCYFVGSIKIFMVICGSEREDKGSLEHHINRKLLVNVYQESEI